MTEGNTPIIEFKGYSIKNLEYTRDVDILSSYDSGFNYIPSVGLNDDKSKATLTVDISLKREENNFGVKVKIQGQFNINESLSAKNTDDIAAALFVNGTAILYPYARSIVSMITGLDSSSTILLPTINTTELWKKFGKNSNK
ncbi:protein-export chaperone SecB [Companilactobacillus hulinensis]|uniref:protein-export chaperone SecB n=1 Tax=Companilactobacillus hulinensis TaxID=2486007 RepID=UPI000F7A77B3|nr:protein-export chaperone SecB [Companilactobacillus hulinensis]